MVVAALAIAVWLVFGPQPNLGHALVAGVSVWIGSDRLMRQEGIALEEHTTIADRFAMHGKTPVFVAMDGRVTAVLAVADEIKALQAQGLKVAIISGMQPPQRRPLGLSLALIMSMRTCCPKTSWRF